MSIAHGVTPTEVGQLLGLCERTVRRFLGLFHQTGYVQPAIRRNGPQKLLGEFEQLLLLRLILAEPGIYLYEIQDKLNQLFEVTVSVSRICRTIKFMGGTRQVIPHVAMQRSEALRAKFMAQIMSLVTEFPQ